MIERCERYFRSLDVADRRHRRGGRPGGDGRARLRPWLRTDPRCVPRQLVAGASRATCTGPSRTEQEARGDTDVGFAEMTRHVHALDWSRTRGLRRHALEPGHPHRRPRSRQRGAAARRGAREDLGEIALPCCEVRRPHDGAALIEEVWTPRAGLRGAVRSARPRPLDGAGGRRHDLDPAVADTIVARRARGARPPPLGGHRSSLPGRGSARARAVDELSIVDVAPLLLHSIGADRCRMTWPARCRRRSSRPGELERRPVAYGPPPAAPAAGPARGSSSRPEEQAAVMERLRALGYVE